MQKLVFDSGVKEYRLGDAGVLRFNPADPDVYARFMAAMDKIPTIEDELVEKAKRLENTEGAESTGTEALRLMAEADQKVKRLLNEVFGNGNDFDEILAGVNLLAVAGNGERVITNLLATLQPILVNGAERIVQQKVDSAVGKAQLNRAQRRKRGKKKKGGHR